MIGVIVLTLTLYYRPYNYTYLLIIYCYIGLGIISAPLIGYYLVRATDIVTFILLLLSICGFVLLSLFSLSRLFDIAIARRGDWVYYLMPYLGIYYVMIFAIAFAISALVKRRISTFKSLLPVIPLVSSIIISIISSVIGGIIISLKSEYSNMAMMGLIILTALIYTGITLFCLAAMCRTIFTEANKQSA